MNTIEQLQPFYMEINHKHTYLPMFCVGWFEVFGFMSDELNTNEQLQPFYMEINDKHTYLPIFCLKM
jgi:hypothetical protein